MISSWMYYIVVGFTVITAGCASSRYAAEIRFTSFDIPHVRAADEAGLGYGLGYAYARDNFCLLAEELVTVNGERSRYFEPNEASDLLYKAVNDETLVSRAWAAQPREAKALMLGYAAGYNRHLRETGVDHLPAACRGQSWVREITALDLVKLIRRYMIQSGMGAFLLARQAESAPLGSNAIALGRERTENGQGMLLANPHFPWRGILRFYQFHLTIPGKLDVMGASPGGMPVVAIGFNSQLAWTHTVNTSKHFTIYELTLDPENRTRYRLDGMVRPMEKRKVSFDMRRSDGSIETVTRTTYSTVHGPLLVVPGRFDWTSTRAFAIRDANLENDRSVAQWYAMNRARTLDDFDSQIQHIVGIPWLNTIAVDAKGTASFLDVSVVPHVTSEQQARCTSKEFAQAARIGVVVLDGSRSDCLWTNSSGTPQPGVYPGRALPSLRRTDYVQNSNDSAWMTHPAAPLTGFPEIVSRGREPLNLRTRFALSELAGTRTWTSDRLGALVMNNEVFAARLVLADLLKLCGDAPATTQTCETLRAWDGTANTDSYFGYSQFETIARSLMRDPDVWAIAFDPDEPIATPRGLRIEDPKVRARVMELLQQATDKMSSASAPNAVIGDVRIPVHGGSGSLGVYNSINSVPTSGGIREVRSGTSYLQLVEFTRAGPRARAILSYSQSSDPASPHAADQTWKFARKEWVELPFTEEAIRQDPAYRTVSIAQSQ